MIPSQGMERCRSLINTGCDMGDAPPRGEFTLRASPRRAIARVKLEASRMSVFTHRMGGSLIGCQSVT